MRKILIVDDIAINRIILSNMLQDDYDVLEAENGYSALLALRSAPHEISAVLLDISMPGMDGYEVLRQIRSDDMLYTLPVIMMTGNAGEESRVESLAMGANDYVTKPYNVEIIKHCLKNNVALHEAVETVAALQRDKLSGLYTRDTFFEIAQEMIRSHESGYYVMACFDIDKFKIINDQYGTEKGDEILRYIAKVFREGFGAVGGICSRISADNFAVLYPKAFLDTPELAVIREKAVAVEGLLLPLNYSIGRYFVNDTLLPPSAMYDRALLAADTVKGRFDASIGVYDEAMRKQLISAQEIVSEMKWALRERQYEVWLQPQYNHVSGALIGAEALVRWRHPDKGLIPPNSFIPIFERNGFIYELDKFVWEQCCALLRVWLDEDRNPLPLSVNISRYDLLRDDFISFLLGLLEKYSLTTEHLRLEVTESAFSNDAGKLIATVKELIRLGFTVEIDDFGSGYSSLNTLKDVPAQVLKLDMGFLAGGSDRGGNILESVVRMAKWLGMSVIAEGVEKKAQADYLQSIGCSYVQGYYYARPMPVEEYVAAAAGAYKEKQLITLETVEHLDNNTFWNPESMDTLIFNSYVGAACIFEYHNDVVELLRISSKFEKSIGVSNQNVDTILKLNWAMHLNDDDRRRLHDALEQSAARREDAYCELTLCGVPGKPPKLYLRLNVRVIAMAGMRYLVYCTYENLSAQRKAEEEKERASRRLRAIMENVDSGITATIVKNNMLKLLFANDRYFSQLGYTREEYLGQFAGTPNVIMPEDMDMVMRRCEAVTATGKPDSIEYRIMRADGQIRCMRSNVTLIDYPDSDDPVQLAATSDITEIEETQRSLLENLPSGAGVYEFKGGQMSLIYQNPSYWRLVGLDKADFPDPSQMSAIHPEDVPKLMGELSAALAQKRDALCDIRLRHLTRGYFPVHLAGHIVAKDHGSFLIYATFTPIAEAPSP